MGSWDAACCDPIPTRPRSCLGCCEGCPGPGDLIFPLGTFHIFILMFFPFFPMQNDAEKQPPGEERAPPGGFCQRGEIFGSCAGPAADSKSRGIPGAPPSSSSE